MSGAALLILAAEELEEEARDAVTVARAKQALVPITSDLDKSLTSLAADCQVISQRLSAARQALEAL